MIERVLRGGSMYVYVLKSLPIDVREHDEPASRIGSDGFRLVVRRQT